jgi:hypothetical protein
MRSSTVSDEAAIRQFKCRLDRAGEPPQGPACFFGFGLGFGFARSTLNL